MRNRFFKKLIIFAAMLIVVLPVCGCSGSSRIYPTGIDELDGLRAGAAMGTIHDVVIEEHFPNSEISYYNTYADQLLALENNKVDYFVADEIKIHHMTAGREDFLLFEDSLFITDFGYIFRKDTSDNDFLEQQMNDFIKKSAEDGFSDYLHDKWLVNVAEAVDNADPLDFTLTGENGIIRFAVSQSSPPFCFVSKNELNGYDIEFFLAFCREYGYGAEFHASDFAGMIPAVSSGKCDIGGSSISITEERAKSVDFSDSYCRSNIIAVVAKDSSSFSIDKIVEAFKKTFIDEDRWKTILEGLGVSMIITFTAAVAGSLLGFIIYMICRRGNRFLNGLFDAFTWIYKGLPAVVILMILYYVIFADSALSGVWISAIAFGISVGVGVYAMLKTAVLSIGRGQKEGAYSLGFTDSQTFFRIILPQAMPQFLPNYKSALITLLHSTSIVGYIAVQDLTKVSDIIRSRTFEAFFPLIATALIYLFLVWLISLGIKAITKRFDYKRRSIKKIKKKFKQK